MLACVHVAKPQMDIKSHFLVVAIVTPSRVWVQAVPSATCSGACSMTGNGPNYEELAH